MLRVNKISYEETFLNNASIKNIKDAIKIFKENKIDKIYINYTNLNLKYLKKIDFKNLFYYDKYFFDLINLLKNFNFYNNNIYFKIKKINKNFINKKIEILEEYLINKIKKNDINIIESNNKKINFLKIKLNKGENFIFIKNILFFTIFSKQYIDYSFTINENFFYINVSNECEINILFQG